MDEVAYAAMSLQELRQLIDRRNLPVKKGVGGAGGRTKQHVVADIVAALGSQLQDPANIQLPDAAAQEPSEAEPAAQANQRSRAPDPADCAGMRAVRTLLEPCDAPQEETLLRELFGSRVRVLQSEIPSKTKAAKACAPLVPAFEEDGLELVSCRVFEGEQHFFGRGHKKVMRWYCVPSAAGSGEGLQAALERLGDWAALTPRKARRPARITAAAGIPLAPSWHHAGVLLTSPPPPPRASSAAHWLLPRPPSAAAHASRRALGVHRRPVASSCSRAPAISAAT